MPIFYKKHLDCGCVITAFNSNIVNNTFYLSGHNYYHICDECKFNFSKEMLDEILDDIYKNDYKISKNNTNNWIQLN